MVYIIIVVRKNLITKNNKKEMEIMCICGGILEVGIISGVTGLIIKRIKKCSCKCHAKVDECSHCHNECETCHSIEEKHHHHKSVEGLIHKIKHNWLTIIATILLLVSFCSLGYFAYHNYHLAHCEDETHNHHIEGKN